MPSNSILPISVEKKYLKEIIFIRNCAKLGKIRISNHCYNQLSERKIKVSDVFDSIKTGVILEIQNKERDIKILFQDSINKPPCFFVTIAVKDDAGLCVTAYLPDKNKWVLGKDNQWRRK